ncbi:MAG: recombination-associated protein RdgC [Deltaproteobacteria bacterium]|nr:recombination-associated protein RdgC [Deltaproteobacteria bacterium]
MGLLRGSASFSRYIVNGTPPENYPEAYVDCIIRYSFRGFDENSDLDRSTGWVNIMNIFDTEFQQKQFHMYPYLSLSLRADTRKVPSNALKQHCLEEEHRVKVTENLEYLSKERRREIKEITMSRLLKRAIPRTNTYDMIWNTQTSMLIFGTTSNRICDEFAELFFKTFGLNLSPVFPYSLAGINLEKQCINPGILDSIRPFNVNGD